MQTKGREKRIAYMNKRTVGTAYEQKAVAYLESCGYRVLGSNYRCPAGEIDLIAAQGGYLVFVEVKYRGSTYRGSGLEAVDRRKQRKILQAALWYATEQKLDQDVPRRFDVLSFLGEEITLIQDAFQY